jgi:putative oxidoreductase
MGMLQQMDQWSIAHHPRWLVVLRILLGFSLVFKAVLFISDTVSLKLLLNTGNLPDQEWLVTTIAAAHFIGGILIVLGLLTRWAVLLQMPILIGAIIFINARSDVFASGSEFILSLVVFILLLFFFAEGGGPVSMDDYLRRNKQI